MSGTLDRVSGDSVVFVRHGHPIRLAMRDVRSVEQLQGRSKARTVAGALIGGATGLVGAAFIGIGGGYNTDGQFVVSALSLSGIGAVIGGVSMGRRWTDWPRTFTAPLPR